jgi:hypothetical protein
VTGILGQTHRIRQVKKLASLVGLDSKHNSEVNIYLASTSTWRQHLLGVNIYLASTSSWRQHLLGVSIHLAVGLVFHAQQPIQHLHYPVLHIHSLLDQTIAI